jgi:hypothetical protein
MDLLDGDQMETFATLLAEKIRDKVRGSDVTTHSEEHEYLRMLIQEAAEKRARRERIKERIAGSFILAGLLSLLGFVGAGAIDWLRVHLK